MAERLEYDKGYNPKKGKGVQDFRLASVDMRSFADLDERRMEQHPHTGRAALKVQEQVLGYLRAQGATTPKSMAKLIMEDGLSQAIAGELSWCKAEAERRKLIPASGTKPYGELFLLSQWLPLEVYSAMARKYGLPQFLNSTDGLRDEIMQYVKKHTDGSPRRGVEFLAEKGVTGVLEDKIRHLGDAQGESEESPYETLKHMLPAGYFGVITAAQGLIRGHGNFLTRSEEEIMTRKYGFTPDELKQLRTTAFNTARANGKT